MRPGHWFLYYLHCFDTDGWMAGRKDIWPVKHSFTNSLRFFPRTGKVSKVYVDLIFLRGEPVPETHTHTQPFYCWSGICPGPGHVTWLLSGILCINCISVVVNLFKWAPPISVQLFSTGLRFHLENSGCGWSICLCTRLCIAEYAIWQSLRLSV